MTDRYLRNPMRSTLWALLLASGPVGCAESPGQAVSGARRGPAPFAVVELFTSEGCSSCPPADRLLTEIVKDARGRGRRVFTLSFHVDYWNRLGWEDPYSDPAHSRRQREYAAASNAESVYTPQMVVNGTEGFVGSDRGKASRAIDRALTRDAATTVTLNTEAGGAADEVVVRYEVEPAPADAVLHVALIETDLTSKVRRGENSGRDLHHDNVVRVFRSVQLDGDGRGRVEFKLPPAVAQEKSWVTAYVQDGPAGPVLGAAGADLPANVADTARRAAWPR